MKKKELETLKTKSVKDLEELATKKREEIMQAKVDAMSGKETNTRRVRNLRHELAQILTIQTIIAKSDKTENKKEEKVEDKKTK